MKSLQADFFKVMKEGAIQYAAPLPFLDLVCVGTATQTEVEEQVDLMYSLIHQQCYRIGSYRFKSLSSACSRGCQERSSGNQY